MVMLPVLLLAAALGPGAPPLEFAGVVFNETSLNAVVERFGQATRWQTGDAGESETKVCYVVQTRMGPRDVYFISGELWVGEIVYGVRITPAGDRRCAAARRNRAALGAAINGFANETAVKRRLKSLGFAKEKPGQWWRCFQEPLHGETSDRCFSVSATWRQGALIRFELWETETN
ncbi:MAG: hypothetical protein LBI48_06240 [Burkholderiaceae bacterium]|jgi:hypothetical protein|nr:hypothetical protein [Burkholderiaceae bacterium]